MIDEYSNTRSHCAPLDPRMFVRRLIEERSTCGTTTGYCTNSELLVGSDEIVVMLVPFKEVDETKVNVMPSFGNRTTKGFVMTIVVLCIVVEQIEVE